MTITTIYHDHGGVKTPIKISLIIIALALLACVVLLVSRRDKSDEPDETIASVADATGRPSFEVRVIVPRLARPLGGILPDWLVAKMDGTPSELRFDHSSAGAKIVNVAPDTLELSSDDGWNLSIEADGEGRITSATRLVFPLALGGRHVKLLCRPASTGIGYLRTTPGKNTDQLNGYFLVKLATCENTASGKTLDWPPSPLTIRGSFGGLPQGRR